MNPNYKSIAIAPVKNDTMEPLASTYLRKLLAEQFHVDGSLIVKNPQEADCILYATVREVETTGVSFDSSANEDNYRPGEWSMSMEAVFTVIVPGKARPLIGSGSKLRPGRTVSGSARYAVTTDQHAARRDGLEQLCRDVAEEIVSYTTEAW